MKIEELIAGLKEKGLSEEEIKTELEKIKADIDAYLTPEQKQDEVHEEVEKNEDKEHRIFGI